MGGQEPYEIQLEVSFVHQEPPHWVTQAGADWMEGSSAKRGQEGSRQPGR